MTCKRCGGWGQMDPSGQSYEVRLCPECPGDGPRWDDTEHLLSSEKNATRLFKSIRQLREPQQ